MGYKEQRDAILVHAAAAAIAVSSEWTDVQIGAPVPKGNRCVRIFYGGETEPVRMGGQRVLNGELVSESIVLIAFWAMSTLDEGSVKALDSECYDFKHQLRTRVLGDAQLGGAGTDLAMSYAQPDFLVIGGARWMVLEVEFTSDFTEYPLAP